MRSAASCCRRLQGAAVTAVQIDGVLHEFSSIPGVREDVTDIVLNIKQLALRMHGEGPKRMTLTATGPGEVRAGQIQAGHDIEIMNPELVICTLDDGVKLGMELKHRHHAEPTGGGPGWRNRRGGVRPSHSGDAGFHQGGHQDLRSDAENDPGQFQPRGD